ncbi:hypothetical protein GGF37_002768 [Kickxella alabastrina]|nr:hypothetical protein GGF37_002768 [Kickxella alabastrina]
MKPATISILLDTPEVHLYGERASSSGCTLTGKVLMSLRVPTKIRSLNITFQGQQKLKYPTPTPKSTQNTNLNPLMIERNRLAVSETQNLIEPQAKYTQYAAGTHELHFEFIVSGDLPATADLITGETKYTMDAQLVLTGLRSSSTVQQPVIILRCPRDGGHWAHTVFDSLSVGTQWEDRVSVTLSFDQSAINDATTATFLVEITANAKNHHLMALTLQLRETQTIFDNTAHTSSRVHRVTRIVSQKLMSYGSVGAKLCGQDEFYVRLSIPRVNDGVQFECECVEYLVSHRLVLTASVRAPEGHTAEVTIPAQFSVLPKSAISGGSELPLYESSPNDQLIQTSSGLGLEDESSILRLQLQATAMESLAGRQLPSYSLPVCFSCGKEDVSVLECRQAIVRHSLIPPGTEIEDLCATLASANFVAGN